MAVWGQGRGGQLDLDIRSSASAFEETYFTSDTAESTVNINASFQEAASGSSQLHRQIPTWIYSTDAKIFQGCGIRPAGGAALTNTNNKKTCDRGAN